MDLNSIDLLFLMMILEKGHHDVQERFIFRDQLLLLFFFQQQGTEISMKAYKLLFCSGHCMFRRVDEQPAASASRLSFWSVTLCVYLRKTVGSGGLFCHVIRAHLMMH